MKKFFKALALVLALTLVIGTIPASAADNNGLKLKKKTKIIYLGGSQGIDAEGTKCKTPSRYKVSKLVKGFDSKKMDITLKSADKSIVKVSSKKDKIYAKGLGTTTVEIFVNNLDGQQLADFKLKVRVKKSATEIGDFAVTDAEGNAVDLTANKAGLNQPYFVTFVHEKDTDYRDLTAADESVSVEKAEALVPGGNTFKVTFTKSGKFTLTASVYQSAEWPGKRLETPVDIVAGYDVAAVEQSALDAIRVTFKTPVTGIEKTAFKAYYEINGVKVYPSDVDTVTADENDKNVVIVKFLAPFQKGETYFVQYDNAEEPVGSFVAINPKKDSVKSIVITTNKVVAGELTEIKYQLLDENGIDITNGIASLGTFKFEMTEGDPINNYVTSITPYKVYMAKAGDTITLKGTYTYVDDANNSIPVVGETKVYAEAPEEWKRGAAEGIVTGDGLLVKTDNTLDDEVKKGAAWTMDKPEVSFQIFVPYSKTTGTKYEGFGQLGVKNEFVGYDIKIADETVALVKSVSGTKATLLANKAGTTSIIIYGKKSDGSQEVIGAANVTVKEARKVGSYTVAAENNKRDLNASYAADKVTFKFDVKDQDGGDYYKTETVKVTCVSDKVKIADTTFDYTRGSSETFTITPATLIKLDENSTLTVKFTIANIEQVVNVTVAADGPAKSYVLTVNPTSVDTAIAVGTDKNPAVTIALQGVSQNGFAAAADKNFTFINYALKAQASDDYTGATGYVFNITKDGKIVEDAAGVKNMTKSATGAAITAFTKDATGAAVKLDKGQYVVTAYNVTKTAGEALKIEQVGAPQTFVVADNQKTAEVKKNSYAESLTDINDTEVAKAFDVTFDGKKIADWGGKVTVSYKYNNNTTTAYVVEAYVTITNATTGNITLTVPVDTLVKKGN
ncbi:MAG: hypothetical protein IK014_02855 [Lachnospiraceae bacterium]|nr:hypothetical protein [Lachnospiraceae bacterium]